MILRRVVSLCSLLVFTTAHAAVELPPGLDKAWLNERIAEAQRVDKALVAGSVVPPGTDYLHATSEVAAYDDLVRDYPNLIDPPAAAQQQKVLTDHYFKDAKFAPFSSADDPAIQRIYAPKDGLVIIRDKKWGIPYIFGDTDGDAWFGAGYVTAEDRLPIMEALRFAGRAEAFELAGTAAAWMADAEFVRLYGYTEEELLQQAEDAWRVHWDPEDEDHPDQQAAHYPAGYVSGPEYDSADAKLTKIAFENYVAGINAYISLLHSGALPLPEALNETGHIPAPWGQGDVIAATMLVRALFGAGGGAELTNAARYLDFVGEFGGIVGPKVYDDLRNRLNHDAPVHTDDASFEYLAPNGIDPLGDNNDGNVMNFKPDAPGLQGYFERAFERFQSFFAGDPEAQSARNTTPADDLESLAEKSRIRWERLAWHTPYGRLDLTNGGGSMSNHMAVARSRSAFDRPILIGGPQAAYFSPEILFEYEMHGPTVHTRGGGFPGLGIGPVVGRADKYAWSPTAGNGDMIDTFVEKLCEPDGSPATEQSRHYLHNGECKPMHRRVIRRIADYSEGQIDLQGIPFSELTDIVAERTVHGPVIARGSVDGEPVAVSRARSTFLKEAHGAIALVSLATGKADTAENFHKKFSPMNLSSNWTYVNADEIAYWHAGLYPIKATTVDHDFPVWGTGDWDWSGMLHPFDQPHDANPQRGFFVSWNNRIAPNWGMQDVKWGFSSLYRADMFEDRILAVSGGEKRNQHRATITPVKLTQMMQEAGVTDFRGSHVVPVALRVLAAGEPQEGFELAKAMRVVLQSWVDNDAFPTLRRDGDGDDLHDHPGAAVMDAWWGPLIEAVFVPVIGDMGRIPLAYDNAPGPTGSAYQDGFYGHVWTQLSQVLGDEVQSPTHVNYCGGSTAEGEITPGDLAACAAALWSSLESAGQAAQVQYRSPDPGQWRALHEPEKIRFVPGAAVTMHWNNRPTYQTLNMFGE